MEENADWREKEDKFQYNQTLYRANLRIKQNRENLLDLICKALLLVDGDIEGAQVDDRGLVMPERDPIIRMEEANLDDLEKLEREVQALEDPAHRVSYWDGFSVVLAEEIEKRKSGGIGGGMGDGAGSSMDIDGPNEAELKIQEELKELLEGQSIEELEQTREELEVALEDPDDDTVDAPFYRAVIQKVPYYQARCNLKHVFD